MNHLDAWLPKDLDTAVMDIDGTLVDSTYHHVLAWHRAFVAAGIGVELWRIHAHIGMGGDRLVTELCGEGIEKRQGDDLRESWRVSYDGLLEEVKPFEGAADLLAELERVGLRVVLATSGHPSHTRRSLEILGLDESDYPFTTSEDAAVTKPAPDLIAVAMEKVGGRRAVVVGDTIWDVQAAGRQRMPAVALLCGGFSECALRDAGAVAVHRDPRDLLDTLQRRTSS